MADYDLTKLTKLGEKYERLRMQTDAVGKEVAAEVALAEAAEVRQVDIVKASRLTRERIRQMRVAREKVANTEE